MMHMLHSFPWLFSGFLGVIMVFVIAIAIFVAIGSYIMLGIGLSRLAERKSIDNPWFAWIPILRWYLYAKTIGENFQIGKNSIPSFPIFYTVLVCGTGVVSSILWLIPILGWILAAALPFFVYVVKIYVMYRFFSQFEGNNAVVFTVVGAVVPFGFPVLVLSLRDKPLVTANN